MLRFVVQAVSPKFCGREVYPSGWRTSIFTCGASHYTCAMKRHPAQQQSLKKGRGMGRPKPSHLRNCVSRTPFESPPPWSHPPVESSALRVTAEPGPLYRKGWIDACQVVEHRLHRHEEGAIWASPRWETKATQRCPGLGHVTRAVAECEDQYVFIL